MQCVATVRSGEARCKRTAKLGYHCCDTHLIVTQYYIQLTYGKYKYGSRVHRHVIGKCFDSYPAASTYLSNNWNYIMSPRHRGMPRSASIECRRIYPPCVSHL